jgi:hypothetical protein
MFDSREIPEIPDPKIFLTISREYNKRSFDIEITNAGVVIRNLPLSSFEQILYVNFMTQLPKWLPRFKFISKLLLKLIEDAFFKTIIQLKRDTGEVLWTGTMR